MTDENLARESAEVIDEEVSLIAIANVLLRWRRMIVLFVLFGGSVGLLSGLMSTRVYTSTATFIPQGSEGGASGLALAANQFGIRVPTSSGEWGPPIYVELLESRALLEPIVRQAIPAEVEGETQHIRLGQLLQIEAPSQALRIERTIRALNDLVSATVDQELGAVKLSVTTPWPDVSYVLANRLVSSVSEFSVKTRKSQAMAEREFVEAQSGEAENALRQAEDRLQQFLERNRAIGSPQLQFEYDRLQRAVAMRQQVYSGLLQSLEDAKIREVRNTPVVTVLERPRLPIAGEPRNSVQKAMLGGILGGIVGMLIAFIAHGIVAARRSPSDDHREFLELLDDATPRFLKSSRR